jgi:xanthine dehydrogenase/oxidase
MFPNFSTQDLICLFFLLGGVNSLLQDLLLTYP